MVNQDPEQNRPRTPSEVQQQQRQVRQEQPQDVQPKQSRPIIQPLLLGDLSLPSATTQTTVGAAGGASALPATPTGYFTVNIGNASFVVPFYAPS